MLTMGHTLAGYRIESVLGEGGMGTVYEATQLSLQRKVALKVLAPHLTGDDAFRERFRREATLQAALEHPNIVTVYEAGDSEEGLFIATRLVRGANLKQLIEAGLPPGRSLRIVEQVAAALDAAHAHGLVHRDVKPQNILVDERDEAYLADFGLIRDAAGSELTRGDEYVGTLDYVSPEQIRGEPVTGRSDLYALAVVLYESLSGEVPFARDTDAAILYAHLEEPPPRITERRDELPPALDDVLEVGLDKDPAERYASGAALVAAAKDALERASTVLETPPPVASNDGANPGETVVERSLPPPAPIVQVDDGRSRLRPEWIAAGAAALLALIAAGFLLGRLAHAEPGESPRGLAVGGPIALSFPADEWAPTPDPPDVPGLALDEPIALAELDQPGATLAAGLGRDARGPRLLPPAFVALLERTPRREAVRIGDRTGFRYSNLLHRRVPGPLTVYAIPTNAGVATLVCLASGEALRRCESVATSVSLRGVQTLPLGANQGYATAVNTALTGLGEQRADLRAQLRAAKSRLAQARSAAALATAFAAAATALDGVRTGPVEQGVHRSLVASIRRAAEAYRALAAAARSGRRRAYDEAAASVGRAEEAIDASLNALGRLGYRVAR